MGKWAGGVLLGGGHMGAAMMHLLLGAWGFVVCKKLHRDAVAELYGHPPAWLAYAAAKRASGDLAGAEMAAQSAAEAGERLLGTWTLGDITQLGDQCLPSTFQAP